MAKKRKAKWKKIGGLKRTRRDDMMRGEIYLEDLGVKINVVAFLRTPEQKRMRDDPDIDIMYVQDEPDEVTVDIPNLFD